MSIVIQYRSKLRDRSGFMFTYSDFTFISLESYHINIMFDGRIVYGTFSRKNTKAGTITLMNETVGEREKYCSPLWGSNLQLKRCGS
jgi:hypothetical protein